jgi:hypothetical protein
VSDHQRKIEANEDGWPIYELWDKYEQIAMRFNDLLIRLRTQALAGVATLTTIIGIFAKSEASTKTNWEMVAFALAVIIVFWLAVWVLDFTYYNRLPLGATAALFALEEESKHRLRVRSIDMSTQIREAVANRYSWEKKQSLRLVLGRWVFYSLVLLALAGALAFAIYQTATVPART